MNTRGLSMPLVTYRRRRAHAAQLLESSLERAVPLLLIGCDENRLRSVRQDPWFDYYSGCAEPDAALLIEGVL